MRTAIERNELSLYFQPQYNLFTKELIGAEVLLRWYNEKLGHISPVEFIPIAENSHLIIKVSDWVLEETCKLVSNWEKQYRRPLKFSINVSPIQFSNHQFLMRFKKILKQSNLPAQYLGIEITEGLLMSSPEKSS